MSLPAGRSRGASAAGAGHAPAAGADLGAAGPPATTPIGLHLAQTAKVVSRAFDDALAEAGGSVPVWLILISLKTRRLSNQRELAEAVGIREATLTHHLNAMDADGLVTRRRDPANRRVHMVEITEAGEAAFHRLRGVVVNFDARLRAGFSAEELAGLGRMLDRLRGNAVPAGGESGRENNLL